jgi:D-alanyl-D-alanine carboxypeptidase
MLKSGNDASIAIAEGISGSVDEFLKLMNEYAIQIGATNSHFESPHGLDSQYHYSTAYDLAMITAVAKENDMFNNIVGVKDVDAEQYGFTRSYHNINKILYQIPGANGVKTGYTGNAGKCLVTSIADKEDDIIIVVLNCTKRWNETKKIYDYVKQKYDFKKVVSKDEVIESITYNDNTKVDLLCDENIVIPIGKDENYEVKAVYPKTISKFIPKGSSFGKICIYKNGTLIVSKALKNKDEIKIKSNIIKDFINKYIK